MAFATIGGTKYPPFYGTTVAPHVVTREGKVYVAYQNELGQPLVMSYDMLWRRWHGPVLASDHGLGLDKHGSPAICIDRLGLIHLFFGCHGGHMHYVRSTHPHNITEWELMPPPAPKATYPQAWATAGGGMWLFYRGGGTGREPWYMKKAYRGIGGWGEAFPIIHLGGKLRAYCSTLLGWGGRTLHLFWNVAKPDDNRYNLYYLQRRADGYWANASGAMLLPPITQDVAAHHCLVCHTDNLETRPVKLAVDTSDCPFIKFSRGTGPHRWRYAYPVEGKWVIHRRPPEHVAGVLDHPGYQDPDYSEWFVGFKYNEWGAELFLQWQEGGG